MRLKVRVDELEEVAGRDDPPEPQVHEVGGRVVGWVVAGLQQAQVLGVDNLVQDGVRHVVEMARTVVRLAALAHLGHGRHALAGTVRGAGQDAGIRRGGDGIKRCERTGRGAQVRVRAIHVVVPQQLDEVLGDLSSRLGHLQVALVLQGGYQDRQTARLAQLVQDPDQSFPNLRLVQHDDLPVLLGEGDVGEGAIYHALVGQVMVDDLLPEFQGVRFHLPVQVGDGGVGHDVVVLGQYLHGDVLVFVDGHRQGGCFGPYYAFCLDLKDPDYFLLKLTFMNQ